MKAARGWHARVGGEVSRVSRGWQSLCEGGEASSASLSDSTRCAAVAAGATLTGACASRAVAHVPRHSRLPLSLSVSLGAKLLQKFVGRVKSARKKLSVRVLITGKCFWRRANRMKISALFSSDSAAVNLSFSSSLVRVIRRSSRSRALLSPSLSSPLVRYWFPLADSHEAADAGSAILSAGKGASADLRRAGLRAHSSRTTPDQLSRPSPDPLFPPPRNPLPMSKLSTTSRPAAFFRLLFLCCFFLSATLKLAAGATRAKPPRRACRRHALRSAIAKNFVWPNHDLYYLWRISGRKDFFDAIDLT